MPFSALFVNQALGPKIKDLKGVGSLVGITQNEVSRDRTITAPPHFTSIVSDSLGGFPRLPTASDATGK